MSRSRKPSPLQYLMPLAHRQPAHQQQPHRQDDRGNHVVSELPRPVGRHVTVTAPTWLTALLRVVSAGFSGLLLWLTVREWPQMPAWTIALATVLIPSFLLMALHPRGWVRMSTVPFLHADRDGMYVPSGRPQALGRKETPRWLFIPWDNIASLGVCTIASAEGRSRCGAFAVAATEEEVREFLHEGLIDPPAAPPGFVAAALYLHSPPGPKTVVESLRALARHHGRTLR